ncbi:MAG: universal stress protein UspA [Rhodobacterales bacterium]|nr:MAG: universal stress protein UspA [Rhodobacterales bacterium]
MTNTLIALVDGSAYAESVCHHAAWIAKANGWGVKLYHVMPPHEDGGQQDLSGAIRLGARSRLLEKLSDLDAERAKLAHEHGRAILDDARALIEADGISVETRLRQGDLIETITAKEDSGEAIVIGKRGETEGVAMQHLGSNLERILRATHKPVLIANSAFQPVSRVLVAFDGSASAQRAVERMAQSALFGDLRMVLVTAGKDTPAVREALERAQKTLQDAGRAAEILIREGEPEAVLAQLTEEDDHELLVMGAYGHSRVRRLIIGSTTTEMIRSCKVPVLVMR